MKKRNYSKLYHALKWLLTKSAVAVIMTVVLSAWSCSSKKDMTEKQQRKDSLSVIEISSVRPVVIPESQVTIALAPVTVQNLPAGAVFNRKQGQASVEVEYRDSLIFVTATCDSLQLLCESYRKEMTSMQSTLEQTTTETRRKARGIIFWSFICGWGACMAVRLVFKRLKNKL